MESEREMIIKELAVIMYFKEAQRLLNKNINCKDVEQSKKLRMEGNHLYAKARNPLELEETYKLYCQSIAFAESNSEELAAAYGNRSAVLYRMKKYKECISDIDLATKINNSDKFKIKLLCRKIKCINLQGSTKSEEILSEVEKSKSMKKATILGSSKENDTPKHVKIINEKENENPFDSVSIKWSKKYGRYLVANRDFNAGEIVFIEKPYVKILNLKNSHLYCGHCLTTCWSVIPCNSCNWCMFCSEECKKMSWEQYHNIECSIVSKILQELGSISHYEQLAIRALILGIKDAGSIQNLKSQLEDVDACTDKAVKGFKNNGSCKSMGFQSLYTLNDDVAVNRLTNYTRNSVLILLTLIKFSSLFDSNLECSNVQKLLANDQVLFVGSLLLKLYKVNDKNCQQLPGDDPHRCKHSNVPEICNQTHCCNRGFSTMIISSLINNSCHQQVINIINKQSKFIVCSLRPIKRDSQIFITYCGNCFDMPKANRQLILRKGFNFTCNCEACENDWPTIQELMMSMQRNHIALLRNPKEQYHANANDALIKPFIENYSHAKCNLNVIETLSKAISKAYKDLKHPSIALTKLEMGMQGAVEKLYLNC